MDKLQPVAWMHKENEYLLVTNKSFESFGHDPLFWIPLYTHPAKTEDEEIFSEMLELLIRYRNETPLGNQPHMIAHVADDVIARAILRKAHEK